MAIGAIKPGDLIWFDSGIQQKRGLAPVDEVDGDDLYLHDPANPAVIRIHISRAEVRAVYRADSKTK